MAQGANVVVYFAPWTEQGWADALSQIANDTAHDPSVLSISWGWPELDAALAWEWTPQTVSFVSIQFTMLAAFGTTVLVCSGDTGTDCGVNDGRAHVLYPASDPGVIACGGTRLALDPFFEQTWKDPAIPPEATGGGVSDLISPQAFRQVRMFQPLSTGTAVWGAESRMSLETPVRYQAIICGSTGNQPKR